MGDGRMRIIGPGGEFVKLTEAEQKTVDSISKKEARAVKAKDRAKAEVSSMPPRRRTIGKVRAYREVDYRKK